MHYKCLVITKEFPTENIINEKIEQSGINYDWFQIGGRYGGSLKLKVVDNDDKYRWEYYVYTPRNGRLFWSSLLIKTEELRVKGGLPGLYRPNENEFFLGMGMLDGHINVDGGYIDDMINFEKQECYYCIDKNDNLIERKSFGLEDKDFDKQFDLIKKESGGCYVVIIDLHD